MVKVVSIVISDQAYACDISRVIRCHVSHLGPTYVPDVLHTS